MLFGQKNNNRKLIINNKLVKQFESKDFDNPDYENSMFILKCRIFEKAKPIEIIGLNRMIHYLNSISQQIVKNIDIYVAIQ